MWSYFVPAIVHARKEGERLILEKIMLTRSIAQSNVLLVALLMFAVSKDRLSKIVVQL